MWSERENQKYLMNNTNESHNEIGGFIDAFSNIL